MIFRHTQPYIAFFAVPKSADCGTPYWNILSKKTRTDAGRSEDPSYGIVDSQSVKTVAAGEERGIDGGKKRKAESGTS